MDDRFIALAAAAADRHDWLTRGWIIRLGTHTFQFAGSPRTWQMTLAAALGDAGGGAAVSGRSAAALHRLDGFGQGPIEIWVPRSNRNRLHATVMRSSARPLLRSDVATVDGIRWVSAERLILDSLQFRFTQDEIHNAIDSAIRMRLVSEKRLGRRIIADLPHNAWHRRRLIDALVDAGGESALERRFLAMVRTAGLPRPELQRVYKSGTRTIARVDAQFANGLVIELAGHGTHATRLQRQRDAQRHTELTLRRRRVITFTYDDVYGRPGWMVTILRDAG